MHSLIALSPVPQFAFCVAWALWGNIQVNTNFEAQVGVIVWEFIVQSRAWAVCAIVYLILLVIICLVLAIKAQNQSTQNEFKFISYSLLFCFLVGMAFVPAYSSTHGMFAVASEIFAIVSMGFGVLGCIFIPKCYFILFKIK